MIPATHPGLEGHFPGNPIVPGVVILDHVVSGLTSQLQGAVLDYISQVKFLRPLLPDAVVTTTYQAKSETLYRFSCVCNSSVMVSGQIQLIMCKG
jgi:3-hydroxymyristoyl/3-hydroxydecanoyl-(acyl carrier protein) dehydratase